MELNGLKKLVTQRLFSSPGEMAHVGGGGCAKMMFF
jgi:hypothetical protein